MEGELCVVVWYGLVRVGMSCHEFVWVLVRFDEYIVEVCVVVWYGLAWVGMG